MNYETDFLDELILLRNDPDVVVNVERHARDGNPHAQYAMGLIYAEGRGVAVDLAVSYAWLTLAVMQGDRAAEQLRNIVAFDLDDAQFADGKMMAAELEDAIRQLPLIH